MFNTRENLYDLLIILFFIIWGIWALWMPEYTYWDRIIYAFLGLVFAFLFTECNRQTKETYAQIRSESMKYALTFMIWALGGLKITEVLCNRTLFVEPLGVLFTGFFLQSCYFLIKKRNAKRSSI